MTHFDENNKSSLLERHDDLESDAGNKDSGNDKCLFGGMRTWSSV